MDTYNIQYETVIILQYGDIGYPEDSDDDNDAEE